MTSGPLQARVTPSQPAAAPRLTIEFGDPALAAAVTEGMQQVEARLQAETSSGESFITDKVRHLIDAGGKRFRPMFAILASQYGTRPGSYEVIESAVVVEMTHLATLYHDDVMDEADRRRGVVSANTRWNNSVAILAGDYLLAQVTRVMGRLGQETVAHFSDTFSVLVTGQMRETVGCSAGDPIEHYMQVIREKTGILIGSAGYLGALHGGADEQTTKALQSLGMDIGIIFQIVDDIIDIWSDASQSGKVPGTDLKEGIHTLPVLFALAEDSAPAHELKQLLSTPPEDDATVARALELIAATDARARCLSVIADTKRSADAALESLPPGPATEALRSVIDYTISRVG